MRSLHLALLCAAWAAAPAAAQVVQMPPEVVESTPESRARLIQTMRIADRAVLAYVHRSVLSIQQGHRDGFAQFRTWYRQWDEDQREGLARREVLQKLFMTLVGPALNVFVPGSGAFVEVVRGVVQLGIDEATQKLSAFPNGDVNRFLDEHEARLEGVVTALLDVPEQFRARHRSDFDAARWEYVWEMVDENPGDDDELPEATRRLLANAGVPPPGSGTARRVRDQLLAAQIRGVLMQSRAHRQIHYDWEIGVISEVAALRHLYPREASRYCPVERELHDFYRTPECRRWRPSR